MHERGNLQSSLELHSGGMDHDPQLHSHHPGGWRTMMLTAYDPFAATNAAFRALDQLTGRTGSGTARPLSGMPMDAYRVGDNFVAHFDLPGVDPGSIDLAVEGNTLTISAERSV